MRLLATQREADTTRDDMGNVCIAQEESKKVGTLEIVLENHDLANNSVARHDNPFHTNTNHHANSCCREGEQTNHLENQEHTACESASASALTPMTTQHAQLVQGTSRPPRDASCSSTTSSPPQFVARRLGQSTSALDPSTEGSMNGVNLSIEGTPPSRRRTHGRSQSAGSRLFQSYPSKPPSRKLLKGFRKGSVKIKHNLSQAVGQFLRSIEDFLFPRMTIDSSTKAAIVLPPRVAGGVLLDGCETAEQHYAKVRECLQQLREQHGIDGLRAVGLEYRLLPCEAHLPVMEETSSGESRHSCVSRNENDDDDDDENDTDLLQFPPSITSHQPSELLPVPQHVSDSIRSHTSIESVVDMAVSLPSPDDLNEADFVSATEEDFASGLAHRCHLCMRRLYHSDSNTLITEENRKRYIADGDMYEEVARLCQEYAHDVMCQEGNMRWVSIEPDDDKSKQPIRAIINKDHPLLVGDKHCKMSNRPSLLIATGRGKVRAGIFSRQHLICSGLESATAVPIVREALRRSLNIIIIDPNFLGETHGYMVFEKTMDYLSSMLSVSHHSNAESCSSDAPLQARDLYVLSHSASGGHLARYLLDKSEEYLPHIRAIAFTDSTHNIQWAKTRNNCELHNFLESSKCVYFRSSKVRVEDQSQWYLNPAGEEIQTDSFWQHRFGKIKTYWAGTNEHSLTNWYAHNKIWEHFDRQLGLRQRRRDGCADSPDHASTVDATTAHPHFSLREPGKVLVI